MDEQFLMLIYNAYLIAVAHNILLIINNNDIISSEFHVVDEQCASAWRVNGIHTCAKKWNATEDPATTGAAKVVFSSICDFIGHSQ